jgi:hypothetical protein
MELIKFEKKIKVGFTKKAENQGMRAKIHILNSLGVPLCNPYLDIDFLHIFDEDAFPQGFICKTCERIHRGGRQ